MVCFTNIFIIKICFKGVSVFSLEWWLKELASGLDLNEKKISPQISNKTNFKAFNANTHTQAENSILFQLITININSIQSVLRIFL